MTSYDPSREIPAWLGSGACDEDFTSFTRRGRRGCDNEPNNGRRSESGPRKREGRTSDACIKNIVCILKARGAQTPPSSIGDGMTTADRFSIFRLKLRPSPARCSTPSRRVRFHRRICGICASRGSSSPIGATATSICGNTNFVARRARGFPAPQDGCLRETARMASFGSHDGGVYPRSRCATSSGMGRLFSRPSASSTTQTRFSRPSTARAPLLKSLWWTSKLDRPTTATVETISTSSP
jgi:hypothetical protein